MSRNKNKILVFKPLVLLLLSSFSHAVEFLVKSSDGACEVTVNSPITSSLIEDQIKENCPGATKLFVTGLGVQLIYTSYCTLLPNLTQFMVSSTSADRFDEDFKENQCANLKKLELFYNKLPKLPINGFRALSNLETLDLSINQLESLPSNGLRNLKNLKKLDLSLNQLESLDSDAFMGLEKLTTLGLTRNRFTQLPADLFKPLVNLESLTLDGNNLQILDLNSIAANDKLKNFYCNACELTTILPSETALKLEIVELKSNQLTDITALNRLLSLETLELANNVNLTMAGVEFGLFMNLKILDLGNVSLSTNLDFLRILPSSLTRLYLAYNSLGSFALNQLSHLEDLEYLNLEATGLKTLNVETVPSLFPKMEEIDMGKNKFSKVQSEALKEFCESISIICNI